MTAEYTFGRKTDGAAIHFFHADESVRAATDSHLLHTHKEAELYLCLCGDCDFIIGQGRYPLRPGTLIFPRPGELHTISINGDCRYNRYYLRIPADYFSFYDSPDSSPLSFMNGAHAARLSSAALEEATGILERMQKVLEGGGPDVLATELFYRLCGLCRGAVLPAEREEDNLLHPTVRRVAELIRQDFANIRSVHDLARQVGVSDAYLSRLFRANMKTTVTAYLRFCRMEQARKLLCDGMSLLDVCSRCGYSDYSYFIAEFRRENGVTPVRFQKSRRGGTAPDSEHNM